MSNASTGNPGPQRRFLLAAGTVLLLLGIAQPAAAQFRTLDRQGDGSKADVAVSFVIPDPVNSSVVRFDLYGQAQLGNWGFYGSLPISQSINFSQSAASTGNLEGGVVHVFDVTGPFKLVSHMGVSFATAGSEPAQIVANFSSLIARPNELFIAAVPNQYALRMATSPRFSVGIVFLQGDVGFDFAFPSGFDAQTYFRLNLGAGVNILAATVTAEFANVRNIGGGGVFLTGWLNTATLSVAMNTPVVKPYIAFTSPLNGGLAGAVYEGTIGAKVEF